MSVLEAGRRALRTGVPAGQRRGRERGDVRDVLRTLRRGGGTRRDRGRVRRVETELDGLVAGFEHEDIVAVLEGLDR